MHELLATRMVLILNSNENGAHLHQVFLHLRFGEGEDFHFVSIIIRVSYESSKYVYGRVVAESFAFEM